MARSFSLPPDAVVGLPNCRGQPDTVHTRRPVSDNTARQFALLPEPPFSCEYASLDDGALVFDGCLGTKMPNGETVHEYNCSYWWHPEGITKTPF